eukprot:TRINITY_DN3726_c0_g1_i1.p1 TRINITY_DN3726_c0_g1~~TRINITY_DN3726_c0_g1_i1.p1  ORF type:complete len:743 (+),score=180.54 TRINITY_DN3726_c0_g1_i1:169-2229(+)
MSSSAYCAKMKQLYDALVRKDPAGYAIFFHFLKLNRFRVSEIKTLCTYSAEDFTKTQETDLRQFTFELEEKESRDFPHNCQLHKTNGSGLCCEVLRCTDSHYDYIRNQLGLSEFETPEEFDLCVALLEIAQNELRVKNMHSDLKVESENPSEMLWDVYFGFPCIEVPCMATRSGNEYPQWHHNKNTLWNSGHLFRVKGQPGYLKWEVRPDTVVRFQKRNNDERSNHFRPLLITAEHKAAWKTSSNSQKFTRDITKLMYELLLSAHSLKILKETEIRGRNVGTALFCDESVFLFGWTLHGKMLRLFALELTKQNEFKFYESLKVFDCEKLEEAKEAVLLSFLICKYAAKLADSISEFVSDHSKFRDVDKLMSNANNLSSTKRSKGSDAVHEDEDVAEIPTSPLPESSSLKLTLESINLIKAKMCESGLVSMVENRFTIGSLTDEGFVVDRHASKLFNGRLLSDGSDVVIKIVSTETARYVSILQSKFDAFREENAAEQRGFLFPLHCVVLDERRCGVVMKAVKPLSECGRLALGQVIKLAHQVLVFLYWCMKLEIVHGDLKLANMGLSETGSLLVYDWEEGINGTTGYRAPELSLSALGPDFVSDLFSAGIVLQELVSQLTEIEKCEEQDQIVKAFAGLLTSADRSLRIKVGNKLKAGLSDLESNSLVLKSPTLIMQETLTLCIDRD